MARYNEYTIQGPTSYMSAGKRPILGKGGGDFVSNLFSDLGAMLKVGAQQGINSLDPTWTPETGGYLSDTKPFDSWTGHLTKETQADLYDAGMSKDTLNLNNQVQDVGDRVAPAVASYYFGPWMNSAMSGLMEGSAEFGAEAGSGSYGYMSDAPEGWTGWGETASPNYGYSLGGESYMPSELPFNPNGIDISQGFNAGDAYNYMPGSEMSSFAPDSYNPITMDTSSGTGLNLMDSYSNVGTNTPTPDAYNPVKIEGEDQLNQVPGGGNPSMEGNNQGIGNTQTANLGDSTSKLDLSSPYSPSSPGTGGGVNWSDTSGSTGLGMENAGDAGISGRMSGYSPRLGGGTGAMDYGVGTQPTLGWGEGSGSTLGQTQPTLWDSASNLASKAGGKVVDYYSKPMNAIKGLSSLNSMYNSSQAANQLQSAQAASDPFAAQRAQYQQKLAESYSNPQALYNSPEYQGLNSMFMKQIQARDAASGRNSQYGARAAEQQAQYMAYLDNYRKGLQGASGANINPSGASAQLAMAQMQQRKNMGDSLFGGLNYMFGSPSQQQPKQEQEPVSSGFWGD